MNTRFKTAQTIVRNLFLIVALLGLNVATVNAQSTVAHMRGVITSDEGTPLSNATVTTTNTSGISRTTTTNESGEFSFRNLPVGNDYTVIATKDEYAGKRAENINLNLGQTAQLAFALASSSSDSIEEVTVYGATVSAVQVAVGPKAVFGLDTLESAPAINRNITDILRADPRIYVDEARGSINAIQCAGQNPRFNSFTLDGVRINDSFGLNSNGYPTERAPFSFDAIQQVSAELAPFDVEYGGFTACNINMVTKSGSNELNGSVFYDYTGDSLRGDSLEGDSISTGDYTEKRYGINFNGALIEDKLFFAVAYEKLEGANLFDRGPIGSGAVDEIEVTQAELDEIAQISRDLYQYDPGTIPNSRGHDDEKLLVKLDWNISDTQRAAFTYMYNDGFNTVESDGDSDEFEFSNHLYERGSELNGITLALYSDWNDRFSSEIRLGTLDVDARAETVGGNDFGEIRVELDNVDVYLGGDDSRQANSLNYENNTISLKGKYAFDNGHNLSFGYEREDLDVFNLFVQHTETEIRFRGGIDAFRAGTPSAIYYNNAPSNNPNDAAAVWGYAVDTLFVQDEFDVNDRLSIVAGLRYDRYSTGDAPGENPDFVADYGFSNSTNLDGEGLLQPRIAFTFDATDNTTVRGGIGIFSGGNPNVWLSNNFSANNVLQFGQRGRSFGYTDGSRSLFDADVVYSGLEAGVPNGPGYGVPSELFDAVAGGVGDNFEINYLDPNFELPSDMKISLGATYISEGDYQWNGDLFYTKSKNTAIVKHGDIERTGFTAEGYPIYDSVREASFVLTNSDVGNKAMVVSLGVSKEYDNGFSFTAGYAYSDAEDVSPMTSSVAFSNYQNRAFFDPEEEVLSTSNYNIKNRLTFTGTYRRAFFGDNMTTFSFYSAYNSGRPYSRTFNGTINPYGFTPFLDFRDNVLRPGTSRNSEEGSSWTKVDIKIEQEFPGFREGDKASAFLVIDNFTNFLNDDWGILNEAPFPQTIAEDDTSPESRVGDASRYEIRFGIKYNF
jgi:outer membrane receptor for ferrienterochelin and colicin